MNLCKYFKHMNMSYRPTHVCRVCRTILSLMLLMHVSIINGLFRLVPSLGLSQMMTRRYQLGKEVVLDRLQRCSPLHDRRQKSTGLEAAVHKLNLVWQSEKIMPILPQASINFLFPPSSVARPSFPSGFRPLYLLLSYNNLIVSTCLTPL